MNPNLREVVMSAWSVFLTIAPFVLLWALIDVYRLFETWVKLKRSLWDRGRKFNELDALRMQEHIAKLEESKPPV